MGSSLAAQQLVANFVVGQVFLLVSAALGGFCFLPFASVGFIASLTAASPRRGKTLEQIISDLNAEEGVATRARG